MAEIPNRRQSIVRDLEFSGERFQVGMSRLDNDPSIFEVFITGPTTGSALWALCQEQARALSIDLQAGMKANVLARRAEREPDGAPVSIYGAVLDLIMEEQGATVRRGP